MNKEAAMPRGKSKDEKVPAREVIDGRLYLSASASFNAGQLDKVTVLVILGGDGDIGKDSENMVRFVWTSDREVDEKVLEGVVRLCSSAMKGREQRVLLVGEQDAIDTVAACILREYLGCSVQTSLAVMRRGNSKCLSKVPLVATVTDFKPS